MIEDRDLHFQVHAGAPVTYSRPGTVTDHVFSWLGSAIERWPEQWFAWRFFDMMIDSGDQAAKPT
jgi:hypothetical protein